MASTETIYRCGPFKINATYNVFFDEAFIFNIHV